MVHCHVSFFQAPKSLRHLPVLQLDAAGLDALPPETWARAEEVVKQNDWDQSEVSHRLKDEKANKLFSTPTALTDTQVMQLNATVGKTLLTLTTPSSDRGSLSTTRAV